MTLSWRDHPDARAEFIASALELEAVHAGLGDQLLNAAERALTSIANSPDAWPPLLDRSEPPQLLSRAIAPFRLRVIYAVKSDSVLVVAYAHEGRRPGYWRSRIGSGL